jgi:nucleotidyltransferase AbiEii toxin of type IV toxin-antitoxin system
VDDFHRTLARIGFDAGDDLGLVLAGGYAISQYGLTSRPSRDVDFATASPLPLAEITDRLAQAYQAAGYTVTVVEATSRMARMDVTDGTRSCEIDLLKEAIGPPTRLTVGPHGHLPGKATCGPGWPANLTNGRVRPSQTGTPTSTSDRLVPPGRNRRLPRTDFDDVRNRRSSTHRRGWSRDHPCLEARELAICTGSGPPATVSTDFAF